MKKETKSDLRQQNSSCSCSRARSTRVVFLLLKQCSLELTTEAEVFLMLFIKIIGDENDGAVRTHGSDH